MVVKDIASGTAFGAFVGLCMSFGSPFMNVLKLYHADGIQYTIDSDFRFLNVMFPYHLAANLLIGALVGLVTTCICLLIMRIPYSLLATPAIAVSCGLSCAVGFSQESMVDRMSTEYLGVLFSFTEAFFVGVVVSIQVSVWSYNRLICSLPKTDNT